MVVQRGDPNMYSCKVLYIGSAVPLETVEGLEAIQEPLNSRYPSDLSNVQGIDSSITVLPDKLSVKYAESGYVLEYPLNKLKICVAVRAVSVVDGSTGEQKRKFVPVNQVECDPEHPAVFSVIIRRTKGRQIQECHSFICNSPRDALHLVNATATANMALKKGNQRPESSVLMQNGTGYDNGYQSDGSRRYTSHTSTAQQEGDVIYIRSSAEAVSPRVPEPEPMIDMEPLHYAVKGAEGQAEPSEVIYIGIDKSNLIKREDNSLQVKPGKPGHNYNGYDQPRYMEQPRQMVLQPPPRAMSAPGQMVVRVPAPAPVLVRRPLPPQPHPMMFGPPPPPPPPQMRMYERHIGPPPRQVVQKRQVYSRSRPRSVSPTRYAASETRLVRDKYHPKFRSHSSDILGEGPPRNFARGNTFMNERAFATRMNGDYRMTGSPMGYYGYPPNAYGGLYDRPITKSNPKYSSSDNSSDGGRDNRFSRSKR